MVAWLDGHPEKPTIYNLDGTIINCTCYGCDEYSKHPIPTCLVTGKPQPVLPDPARYEPSSGAVGRVLLAMVKGMLRPLWLPLYPLYRVIWEPHIDHFVPQQTEGQHSITCNCVRWGEQSTCKSYSKNVAKPERADVYNARDKYKVGDYVNGGQVVSMVYYGDSVLVQMSDGERHFSRKDELSDMLGELMREKQYLEQELKKTQQAQYDLEYKFRGLS